MKPTQLPLGVHLSAEQSFDSYVADVNADAVASLKKQLAPDGSPLLYLWGTGGSGCTHLLQAACNAASINEKTCVYLPMEQFVDESVSILEGLEQLDLVCIDHLHCVINQRGWNEALFHLFNRILSVGGALLVAADRPPQSLGLNLPDLASRFTSCVVYQIRPLSDHGKRVLLEKRAAQKGLKLSEDAALFILNRAERNVPSLLEVLEALDRRSLAEKRKLTIPFIKDTMGW